ncbi:hypothetical protein TWF694_001430 [Orbilia ellipsospora]|uniref:Uncharacterized protein n=1 Tax=Orbilia ellipsospora TaxID=2528407 RepID=A0AAV9XRY9_9PEZI
MANPSPTTTWSYIQIASSTNLGPMTTPFEFPSDCTNLYDFRTTVLGETWSTVYTGGCALSTCCPYSKFYTTAFAWYSSYYSPAVCPQNYQTCDGPWEVASTLGSTEHVRFCCPTGYTCPLWSNFQICETTRTASTTVLVVENISIQKIISTATLPEGTSIYDYAYPLQIRWKDSDFAVSTGLTSTIPTETGPTAGPSSQSPAKSGGGHSGLSTGAIVAIAVVLGVVAILGIVAFLWWRRAQKRRQGQFKDSDTPPGAMPGSYKPAVEMPELDARNKPAIPELDTRNGRGVPELDAKDTIAVSELDSRSKAIHELGVNQR